MPSIEAPAKPVTVTVTKFIAVPAPLTAPCVAPVAGASIATNGDLLDAYLQDAASLRACAAQMDGVRKLMQEPRHD